MQRIRKEYHLWKCNRHFKILGKHHRILKEIMDKEKSNEKEN